MSIFGDAFEFIADVTGVDELLGEDGTDFLGDVVGAGAKTLKGRKRSSSSSSSLFKSLPKYSDLSMPLGTIKPSTKIDSPRQADYEQIHAFWLRRLNEFANMKG